MGTLGVTLGSPQGSSDQFKVSYTSSDSQIEPDDIEKGDDEPIMTEDEQKFAEVIANVAQRADLPTTEEFQRFWLVFGFGDTQLDEAYQAYNMPSKATGILIISLFGLFVALTSLLRSLAGQNIVTWESWELVYLTAILFVCVTTLCTMTTLRNKVFENRHLFSRVASFLLVTIMGFAIWGVTSILIKAKEPPSSNASSNVSGLDLATSLGFHAGPIAPNLRRILHCG